MRCGGLRAYGRSFFQLSSSNDGWAASRSAQRQRAALEPDATGACTRTWAGTCGNGRLPWPPGWLARPPLSLLGAPQCKVCRGLMVVPGAARRSPPPTHTHTPQDCYERFACVENAKVGTPGTVKPGESWTATLAMSVVG